MQEKKHLRILKRTNVSTDGNDVIVGIVVDHRIVSMGGKDVDVKRVEVGQSAYMTK